MLAIQHYFFMNLMEKEQNIGIKITKKSQNGLKFSVFYAKRGTVLEKKYTAAGISGSND